MVRTGGRRRALVLLVAVAVVTAAVVVAGVVVARTGEDPSAGGDAEAPRTPTSLADLDTRTVAVSRSAFCDQVPGSTLEQVLGGAPTQSDAYDDGDRVRLVRGTDDVSHEYGCLWKSGKTIARGWVFAPPVTPPRARQLARETRATGAREDCERLRDAGDYGLRSVVLSCPTTRGTEVSYRGLYGDAWLTCTLSAPRAVDEDDLQARADRFCTAVAVAAS